MNSKNMSLVGLMVMLAAPAYAADTPAGTAPEAAPAPAARVAERPTATPVPLAPNLSEVAKLASAGLGDEVILAYIKNCRVPFYLSADAILRLKELGVSSPVIAAMLSHDAAPRNPSPPAPVAAQRPAPPTPAQPAPQPEYVAPPAPTYVPADQTPPPPQVEVISVSPGPDYYWTPGYWGWNGGWIWIGGGWGLRGGYGWGWGHGGYYGGYHGGYHGGYGGGGYHGGGGGGHSGGGHR